MSSPSTFRHVRLKLLARSPRATGSLSCSSTWALYGHSDTLTTWLVTFSTLQPAPVLLTWLSNVARLRTTLSPSGLVFWPHLPLDCRPRASSSPIVMTEPGGLQPSLIMLPVSGAVTKDGRSGMGL